MHDSSVRDVCSDIPPGSNVNAQNLKDSKIVLKVLANIHMFFHTEIQRSHKKFSGSVTRNSVTTNAMDGPKVQNHPRKKKNIHKINQQGFKLLSSVNYS